MMADPNETHDSQENVPSVQPLIQFPAPIHLKKLVGYLQSDTRDLKTFRLVCSTWNDILNESNTFPIKISSLPHPNIPNRNLLAFTDLMMTQPGAKLKCRSITLGHGIDLKDTETIYLLEQFGHEMIVLKIDNRLDMTSAIFVLKFCKNVVHLSIDPSLINSLELPTMFQDTWDTDLPRLKYLTILAPITSDELKNENNHHTEYLSQYEFIIQLLSKAPNVHSFRAVEYPPYMWEELSNKFTLRPEISSRVKRVDLNFGCKRKDYFFDRQLISLYRPKLNLKTLEIERLAGDVTTKEFSLLLEHFSTTLETLSIHKCSNFDHILLRDIFYKRIVKDFCINFPCKMVALKSLRVDSLHRFKVSCAAPENKNVFEQLPNLKIFHAWSQITDRYWETNPWDRLFPILSRSQVNEFKHNELTQLIVEWCVKTFGIVQQIQIRFPQLTKLTLCAEGSILSEIADVLSVSNIKELFIDYVENNMEGMLPFVTAITGILSSDCSEHATAYGNNITPKKIRKSFGDWSALRDLKFYFTLSHYDDFGNNRFLKLTDFSMKYGFSTWKQLECLTLKSFEIHPKQISNVLENTSLKEFNLNGSKIGVRDTQTGNELNVPVEIQTIREKYPAVIFKCDLRHN